MLSQCAACIGMRGYLPRFSSKYATWNLTCSTYQAERGIEGKIQRSAPQSLQTLGPSCKVRERYICLCSKVPPLQGLHQQCLHGH
eukprot:COSAG03_NODE_911_length_5374_cov_2.484550_2_plen_85_part_00